MMSRYVTLTDEPWTAREVETALRLVRDEPTTVDWLDACVWLVARRVRPSLSPDQVLDLPIEAVLQVLRLIVEEGISTGRVARSS